MNRVEKTHKHQKKHNNNNNNNNDDDDDNILHATCLDATSDVGERANPLRTRHGLRADDAAEASGIVDLHCQSRHSHRRRVEVLRSLTAALPSCSPPPPPPPFMPLRVLPSKKNWLFYPPAKEGGPGVKSLAKRRLLWSIERI